jgi:hypothetical protein
MHDDDKIRDLIQGAASISLPPRKITPDRDDRLYLVGIVAVCVVAVVGIVAVVAMASML